MKNFVQSSYPYHLWIAKAGSAVAAGGLVAVIAHAYPAGPTDAFLQVDDMRCVVDQSTKTLILRSDGQPECIAHPVAEASASENQFSLPVISAPRQTDHLAFAIRPSK